MGVSLNHILTRDKKKHVHVSTDLTTFWIPASDQVSINSFISDRLTGRPVFTFTFSFMAQIAQLLISFLLLSIFLSLPLGHVAEEAGSLSRHCLENPPTLNSSYGAGSVKEIGGLKAYVSGPYHSKRAVILVSDVYGT
jgi:hypothetical protein